MPEYLSPGVYVEEVDSGPRPIEGVGTATAAFVGLAPAGPANRPALITNWSQYVDTFGGLEEGGRRNPHLPGAYLSHTVYGYFLNGGGRCYVTRVVPTSGNGATPGGEKPSSLPLPSRSSKALPSLTIAPKGTVNEDIQVEIATPTAPRPRRRRARQRRRARSPPRASSPCACAWGMWRSCTTTLASASAGSRTSSRRSTPPAGW